MASWSSRPIGTPLGPFFGDEGAVVRVPWLDARIQIYWPGVQVEQFIGTPLWEAETTVYAPGLLPAQIIQLETIDASPTLHSPIPYREGEIYAPLLDASPTIHGPQVAYDQTVEMPLLELFTEFYAPRVSPVGEVEVIPPHIPSGTVVYTPDVKFSIGPATLDAGPTFYSPLITKTAPLIEVSGKWGSIPIGVAGLAGYIYPPRISSVSSVHTPTVGEIDPGTLWMERIGPNTIVYRPSVWGEWGEPGDPDWPDAFMSYPAATAPIHWNGVSNATISYLSFEDFHRADGQPIKLENCHNITIERIDTRGCTMGLVYALNCTNITIRYCRAENIAEEFAGQILDWAPADAGIPGYFRNENDCNFYQFDKVDGFYVHDLKGRYGNMEDVFSHYSTSNGTVERLHFEGGVSTSQPTTTGKPSVPWTSDSGTGIILGDQSGYNVHISDCTMVNCGQVLYQIAGGTNLGYNNCIGYGEGYTSQPWNAGATSWGDSQPCTELYYTNMRIKYLQSDGTENGAWFDSRCTNIDTSGSDFSDDSLNIEDLRVHLEGSGPPTEPTDVLLTPGMSASQIDNAIDTAGAYGTIGISSGTYYGFNVIPHTGQTFTGLGNVTLNGNGTEDHAFSGDALYVTIRNLEITNYDNPPQHGAIQGRDLGEDWYEEPYQGPGGWIVEECEVHHNAGAGIALGYNDATISRCNIHHNRQIGIVISWGYNQSAVDNEISYNNYLVDYDWGWEAGGSKFWETHNLRLARNYVHDNHGPGLWADHGNADTIYEDNDVIDNYGPGIFHEISYECIVRNNVIRGNGLAYAGVWLWGAGIQIANAGLAQIYDNTLENNGNGICFTEQGRGYGPLSGNVYNNYINNSGGTGAASDQPYDPPGPFSFYGNTYDNTSVWYWNDSERDLEYWQQYFPNDGEQPVEPPAPPPTGNVVTISTGLHMNYSVRAAANTTYIGEPGAILDGGNSTRSAFYGDADNVTIRNLEIRNYANPNQVGAVAVDGDDFTIMDCEVHHNLGTGIKTRGLRPQILRNNIHHQHQLGLGVLYGHDGLVEGNELSYNNWLAEVSWGWEAGATKFVRSHRLTIRDNWSHHNHGPGLWSDIDNDELLYEANVVEDNFACGIFHEIGYSAIIRNNTIRRNGIDNYGQNWLWAAGVVLAAVQDTEVYGNTIEGNYNGVTMLQQNRGDGDQGPYLVQNNYVHNNTITNSGTTGAAQDISDPAIYYSNNVYAYNTYVGTNRWKWESGTMSLSEWQQIFPNDG